MRGKMVQIVDLLSVERWRHKRAMQTTRHSRYRRRGCRSLKQALSKQCACQNKQHKHAEHYQSANRHKTVPSYSSTFLRVRERVRLRCAGASTDNNASEVSFVARFLRVVCLILPLDG